MAAANAGAATPQLPGPQTLTDNPVVRQLGVMIGIAASIALGVAVVLWSWTPSYSLLYGSLSQNDATAVAAALQQAGVDYRIDEATGGIMVPSAVLHDVRLKLAGEGLPQGDGLGFELMQQETGFGTSRMVEAARYQRALEGELARSIAALASVETARVHLATPKQSVFVRDRKVPSASVVVRLAAGRALEKGQVEAIVHMVASSVPELTPSKVTVVDQKGRLLSGRDDDRALSLSTGQLEYTRELERHYKRRIEDLLAPMLGPDALRAEVTADVDFTVTEQTQEQFNPDLPALRSEQVNEQQSTQGVLQGVPGALSNQPPAAGIAPQVATADGGAEPTPRNSSRNATRNYELDRTVSHTRWAPGKLRRISVAVVVDDRLVRDQDGTVVRSERTPEEITEITNLVREAIGFDAQRGDSVRVINSTFHVPEALEPLPEPPLWEQPWFIDLVKAIGGVVLVLLLIFVVLLPTMKRLTAAVVRQPVAVQGMVRAATGGSGGFDDDDEEEDDPDAPRKKVRLPGPGSYESTLDAARTLIKDDPKRVAQVVKSWVREDGH